MAVPSKDSNDAVTPQDSGKVFSLGMPGPLHGPSRPIHRFSAAEAGSLNPAPRRPTAPARSRSFSSLFFQGAENGNANTVAVAITQKSQTQLPGLHQVTLRGSRPARR
ncbi:hypothetical protein GCM10010504_65070 [Streptomyces griseus]|nr:hypothetical protein GCM10010504_65070 [Streptomyces griseus]